MVSAAVHAAATALRDQLVALAVADDDSPLHGADPAAVDVRDGRMALRDQPGDRRDLRRAAAAQPASRTPRRWAAGRPPPLGHAATGC